MAFDTSKDYVLIYYPLQAPAGGGDIEIVGSDSKIDSGGTVGVNKVVDPIFIGPPEVDLGNDGRVYDGIGGNWRLGMYGENIPIAIRDILIMPGQFGLVERDLIKVYDKSRGRPSMPFVPIADVELAAVNEEKDRYEVQIEHIDWYINVMHRLNVELGGLKSRELDRKEIEKMAERLAGNFKMMLENQMKDKVLILLKIDAYEESVSE